MRQRSPFRRIGLAEAEAVLQRADVLVLDTRDPDSYAAAHMDGAVRTSHANLSGLIGGTPKHRPILIYCYHGNASQDYAQTFSDFGFAEVYSLDGGYEAWRMREAPQAAMDPALAPWLAEKGFASGDAVLANRATPLMIAAHGGDGEIVRRLLAAGAAPNARNGDGNTAVWLACVGRNLAVIDQLLAAGADIDHQNDSGATALIYAASAGLDGVVAHLLARGADASLETLDGFTALDLAGTRECLALLRPARQVLPSDAAPGA